MRLAVCDSASRVRVLFIRDDGGAPAIATTQVSEGEVSAAAENSATSEKAMELDGAAVAATPAAAAITTYAKFKEMVAEAFGMDKKSASSLELAVKLVGGQWMYSSPKDDSKIVARDLGLLDGDLLTVMLPDKMKGEKEEMAEASRCEVDEKAVPDGAAPSAGQSGLDKLVVGEVAKFAQEHGLTMLGPTAAEGGCATTSHFSLALHHPEKARATRAELLFTVVRESYYSSTPSRITADSGDNVGAMEAEMLVVDQQLPIRSLTIQSSREKVVASPAPTGSTSKKGSSHSRRRQSFHEYLDLYAGDNEAEVKRMLVQSILQPMLDGLVESAHPFFQLFLHRSEVLGAVSRYLSKRDVGLGLEPTCRTALWKCRGEAMDQSFWKREWEKRCARIGVDNGGERGDSKESKLRYRERYRLAMGQQAQDQRQLAMMWVPDGNELHNPFAELGRIRRPANRPILPFPYQPERPWPAVPEGHHPDPDTPAPLSRPYVPDDDDYYNEYLRPQASFDPLNPSGNPLDPYGGGSMIYDPQGFGGRQHHPFDPWQQQQRGAGSSGGGLFGGRLPRGRPREGGGGGGGGFGGGLSGGGYFG